MAVKARFWITAVTKHGNSDSMLVRLTPTVRPTNDNIAWSKYTPSGELTMTITTEGAQQWFEERLGKDVAITFDDPEEE